MCLDRVARAAVSASCFSMLKVCTVEHSAACPDAMLRRVFLAAPKNPLVGLLISQIFSNRGAWKESHGGGIR